MKKEKEMEEGQRKKIYREINNKIVYIKKRTSICTI